MKQAGVRCLSHVIDGKKLFHLSFCSDHQIKYYSKNNQRVLGLFNLYIQ